MTTLWVHVPFAQMTGKKRTCSKIYDSIALAVNQEKVKIRFLDFHAKMYDVSHKYS